MKLLKCHIENFGVLSDFDFEFNSGLTVIYRENGFGKTTFAAFIKAMFYGFPRTAARNIMGNERKRYAPWQGGNYGGFLEFEYQGTSYRVTRYFGKTAAKDTFSAMDLTNRSERTPFTENLGEEIFQLDRESFMRSVYLPQLTDRETEATTSIRTKLSNLVEDTNDLNNYDTAIEALRACRSRYRAFRGSGGRIQELNDTYNDLDVKRYEAERKRPHLEEITAAIAELNEEQKDKQENVKIIRKKIRAASVQETQQMKMAQLRDMQGEIEKTEEALQKMDAQFLAGYPELEEVRAQQDNVRRAQQAAEKLGKLTLSEEDRSANERGKILFGNLKQAEEDIEGCEDQCRELTGITSKMETQMLPEEAERFRELSERFAEGSPAEEELEGCQAMADKLNVAEIQLKRLVVSPEEQVRYENLKAFFAEGVPETSTLAACEQRLREREVLKQSEEARQLTQQEQEEYQALRKTFAEGVPTSREIQEMQAKQRRITELNGMKRAKEGLNREKDSRKTKESGVLLPAGVGALMLVVGILCMVLQQMIPAVLLLLGGAAAVTAAIVVRNGRNGRRQEAVEAVAEEESRELYELKRELYDFLLRYYRDATEPENKLVGLRLDAERFEKLAERKQMLAAQREQIRQEADAKNREILALFAAYYPGEGYRDSFLQELRDACREYDGLNRKFAEVNAERKKTRQEIEKLRSQLTRMLRRYYPAHLPENLRQSVQILAAEAVAYTELLQKKTTVEEKNAAYRKQAAELTARIEETLSAYGALDRTQSYGQCLGRLRKALERYKIAADRVNYFEHEYQVYQEQQHEAEQEIRQFFNRYRLNGENPQELLRSLEESIRSHRNLQEVYVRSTEKLQQFLLDHPNIETEQSKSPELAAGREEPESRQALEQAEKITLTEIDDIDRQLRNYRQERDILRRSVEQISDWEDQMSRIRNERQEAEKKCSLLDQTVKLLEHAKDNLASRYVGPVEEGFHKYADILLKDKIGRVMIDKDLRLHIDEKGDSREVGSFSMGMTDGILLCMRLALLDALFTEETPFLILDDPFVNLDDEQTKRGLEMLQKIAVDHQVIYLVCNRGRI